jgi:hypothetical protein
MGRSHCRRRWCASLPGSPGEVPVQEDTMTPLVREHDGFREARPEEVLMEAQALIALQFRPGAPVLRWPELARRFLRVHLGPPEHEVFGMISLDARGRLIAVDDLFRGGVRSAQIHPREVVKVALARNAVEVIAFHNHPSGSTEPQVRMNSSPASSITRLPSWTFGS